MLNYFYKENSIKDYVPKTYRNLNVQEKGKLTLHMPIMSSSCGRTLNVLKGKGIENGGPEAKSKWRLFTTL